MSQEEGTGAVTLATLMITIPHHQEHTNIIFRVCKDEGGYYIDVNGKKSYDPDVNDDELAITRGMATLGLIIHNSFK